MHFHVILPNYKFSIKRFHCITNLWKENKCYYCHHQYSIDNSKNPCQTDLVTSKPYRICFLCIIIYYRIQRARETVDEVKMALEHGRFNLAENRI